MATLPPTNTLESPAQPAGNIPVVLLVLVAIGSIAIGATVLRPRPHQNPALAAGPTQQPARPGPARPGPFGFPEWISPLAAAGRP